MNSTTSLATQLRKSIDDSVNRLAAAVDKQRGSEEMRRYLDVMARFPMYSWRNACLISLQRPQASLVAGFSHWKRLGRRVRKGEKAVRIISPCPVRKAADEEEERVRMYFKAACVFDVSQTEGKGLPTAEVPEIRADTKGLLAALANVAAKRGITVRYRPMEEGTFGVSRGGEVEIATGHSTGQQSKSLVHELAHEAMHRRLIASDAYGIGRRTAELEAEAVAYVVCRHFDLDVELRASRYIALWGGEGKALAASLGRISDAARRLIEDMKGLGPCAGGAATCRTGLGTATSVPTLATGRHRTCPASS
ncbi:MAG: hypothetical protein KAY37_13315 [Phycisphaerae bacterium]|nr:hypothetical protein [Phycisphaerae bacterium]